MPREGNLLPLAARFAAVAYTAVIFAPAGGDTATETVRRWAGRILDPDLAASTVHAHVTRALPPLGVSPAELLELAAVLRLAGLLFDLLDQLLALRAAREVLDELGDRCHASSFSWWCPDVSRRSLHPDGPVAPGRCRDDGGPHAGYSPSRAPTVPGPVSNLDKRVAGLAPAGGLDRRARLG